MKLDCVLCTCMEEEYHCACQAALVSLFLTAVRAPRGYRIDTGMPGNVLMSLSVFSLSSHVGLLWLQRLLIPLSTATCMQNMPMPLVIMERGAKNVRLLSRSVNEHLHRYVLLAHLLSLAS